jgi:glycosyltransferase involved in cell wall biosynthesis
MKVVFLIDKLNRGGAERQLIELVKGLNENRFEITVVIFHHGGDLRPELDEIDGITVVSLNRKGRWDILPIMLRLWKTIRRIRPYAVHSYMGGTNELCLVLGRLLRARVVWAIRASNVELSRYDRIARYSFHVAKWLSRFVDLIIVNSQAGREYHIEKGYCGKRMEVIPNGIDTERYYPDPEAGRHVRAEWGIGDREFLIGFVGRLDPMKDHTTFMKAAALLMKERNGVRFVCVGNGPESYRRQMQLLGDDLNLGRKLTWAGPRDDMPAVYNAFDIFSSSSSYGEGFSNVVGEAMACGLPCVVTDVGDSALILGEFGIVVPPCDPQAVTEGWKRLLGLTLEERKRIGLAARKRIVREFGHKLLVERTIEALQNISQ